MDEKKKSKLSVWALLFFIALIAICVMGIFLYKLSAEKNIEVERTESLNKQITHLQSRAEVLENTLNQISALINDVMTNSGDQVEEVQEPTEEVAETVNEIIEDENVEEENLGMESEETEQV